ncbi:MAG: MBL fold metallo-hydrolase [Gemmatimonadota bacterium]|jgi:ribonuclease BN (tRNA processing enzyme)
MSASSDLPFRLTVLGCGDAFGSGGRLQTCFHVRAPGHTFLVDCGATASIGIKRFGIDAAGIDTILLSHFHADHYAGLPFLLIEARFSERTRPLTIAGPPGVRERVAAAKQVLFPGSRPEPPFEIRWLEYDGAPLQIGPLDVEALPVVHVPETLPHALRIGCDDAVLAFSGDTEWTPTLRDVAKHADLFLCECAGYDAPTPVHLDVETLRRHRTALDCRRFVLTHMGAEVLANAGRVGRELEAELAEDGMEIG